MGDNKNKITLQRDGENLRIHIPLKFKKRGGRKEIITPDGLPSVTPDRTVYQKPLVVALARAHRWQKLLDEGQVMSISELAKRLEVDRAYVSRLLHLTLLSPTIINSILDGKEPSGLSLVRVYKIIYLLWKRQETTLSQFVYFNLNTSKKTIKNALL